MTETKTKAAPVVALEYPKPFLKWVGGKRRSLEFLLRHVRRAGDFKTYHELFLGGGALFFGFRAAGYKNRAILNDMNSSLILAYWTVRGLGCWEYDLISELQIHEQEHCKDHYYTTRDQFNEYKDPDKPCPGLGGMVHQAARFIYLNKTCFNGLYRENMKGKFNVPMGDYKNPLICDVQNLHAVSKALTVKIDRIETNLHELDFLRAAIWVADNDLVYMDPPYVPLTTTADFTSYTKDGFTYEDHKRLAALYGELAGRGAKVMLSNSDTPLVRELYKPFHIHKHKVGRSVNSKATKRGKVGEVLVTNF